MSQRVRLSLDAHTYRAVQRAAEREGTTITATIRAVLARHFGTEPADVGEVRRRAERAADPDAHDERETWRHP